jgi:hypothetical protein
MMPVDAANASLKLYSRGLPGIRKSRLSDNTVRILLDTVTRQCKIKGRHGMRSLN